MNTIGARIKSLRGPQSQEEFASAFGVHKNTLARWERNERQPDLEFLKKLAEAKHVTLEWLILGEELQIGPEGKGGAASLVLVPKVRARLNAGGGSLETGDEQEGRYAFRSPWIHRKGSVSSMVLMDVSGDSMEPEIRDGDTVLIDQAQRDVLSGKIYAIGIEDTIVVKQLEKLPGKLVLRSMNQAYAPVEIALPTENSTVRVIGRVVWWCREAR